MRLEVQNRESSQFFSCPREGGWAVFAVEDDKGAPTEHQEVVLGERLRC